MNKIELLAPAGNMESLIAAVSAGCDAVYLGGSNFSARAFAGNFNHEELVHAVEYCHDRDVKVYVTMNTLLFEDELENAMKEIDFLYRNDIDAVLIQDIGLFHRVHQEYPDFELHCSTQMHIHNRCGTELMKQMGASRVVLARETPIEVVKSCVDTGVEIEIFAYGALCISYSGQCLMSQCIKNRSGNRGMCAQLCRLQYFPDHEVFTRDGDYLLSPKDLNVIDHIPELIDAGVASLKIEGRMKRPEYVFAVVRTFREAIDAYYSGIEYHVSKQRMKELLLMFNRGFTKGHLFHAELNDFMSHYRPNHQGITVGTVEKYDSGRVLVRLSDDIHQHDGLRILNEPVDTGLTAVRIYKNGLLVNEAKQGELVWLDCKAKPNPRKGQKLQKTSDSVLIDEIDRRIKAEPKTTEIFVSYSAIAGKPLYLKAEDHNGNIVEVNSSLLLEEAKNAPLTKEKIENSLRKNGDFPYLIRFAESILGNVFIPVSTLNETRRNLLEALSVKRKTIHIRRGKQPYHVILENHTIQHSLVCENGATISDKDIVVFDPAHKKPVVDENECGRITICNSILSEIGNLYHELSDNIAGMTLNCANSYSLAFLLSFKGINGVVLSSEITDNQLERMLMNFRERYGFDPAVYLPVYGKRTLMYIKGRFMNEETSSLTDMEGRRFPVVYDSKIIRILEPSLYQRENIWNIGSYLFFTDECESKKVEIEERYYEKVFRRI